LVHTLVCVPSHPAGRCHIVPFFPKAVSPKEGYKIITVTLQEQAITYTFCSVISRRAKLPMKIIASINNLENVFRKAPYCPWCNNDAATLGEIAQTMLLAEKLPSTIGDTLISLQLISTIESSNQDLSNIIYSCSRAIVNVSNQKLNKLDERGEKCLLLAYYLAGSGCFFYSPSSKHNFHSTLAVFPEFQKLPVKGKNQAPNLDMVVKK
ncbi:uncharacterized protein VP01_8982g1, partial [Puccinia sorghi]